MKLRWKRKRLADKSNVYEGKKRRKLGKDITGGQKEIRGWL